MQTVLFINVLICAYIFVVHTDDTLMFSTDGDNSFEDFAVTTRGRDSLAVAVRACSHAYFMLGSVFGDMRTQTYKVHMQFVMQNITC